MLLVPLTCCPHAAAAKAANRVYTCVGTYRSAELAQDTVLALRPLWALHGRDVNALKPLDNCRQHARCHHEFWGPGASGATHPQTTWGPHQHAGFWCCTSCRWNVCYGSVVDSPWLIYLHSQPARNVCLVVPQTHLDPTLTVAESCANSSLLLGLTMNME